MEGNLINNQEKKWKNKTRYCGEIREGGCEGEKIKEKGQNKGVRKKMSTRDECELNKRGTKQEMKAEIRGRKEEGREK